MSNQNADFWNEVWEKDNERDFWSHDFWKNVSPEVVDMIKSESPSERPDVLDLGCGLGRNTIAFAQAGFKVTATDISEAGIKHVREWADKLKLDIHAFTADFTEDVFPENSFDIVISQGVLYHGYRDQAMYAIKNVHKWLKKGGRFYFTFPTPQDREYQMGKKLDNNTVEIEPGHVHCHANEDDINTFLKGFKIISQEKEESPWEGDGEYYFSRWHILAEKLNTYAR